VIPHTWASTTLAQLAVGHAVNLEADLLAKYTERLLGARGMTNPPTEEASNSAYNSPLTASWLADHGWV
jgi:riboflavin synthase